MTNLSHAVMMHTIKLLHPSKHFRGGHVQERSTKILINERLSAVRALSSGTMAMDSEAGVCIASMEQAPSNFLVVVYCFMCMLIGIFIAHAWNVEQFE